MASNLAPLQTLKKKLEKLIQNGNKIKKTLYDEEYQDNLKDLHGDYGEYPFEYYAQPKHYTNSYKETIAWSIQCKNLLKKIPLQNTEYHKVITLFENDNFVHSTPKKTQVFRLKNHEIEERIVFLECIYEDLLDGMFEDLVLSVESQSALQYLGIAQELFDEGEYTIAGIVALCSLESFLHTLCKHIGSEGDSIKQELGKNINFLRNKGVVSKKFAKTLHEWRDLRNILVHI